MTFRRTYKNVCTVILWRMDTVVGCLLVTHFPVKAELARQPDLVGRAVVVATGDSGRRLVVDASPEARGVRAGQMLTEALSWCADAVVLAVDDHYLSSLNDDLMHSLFQVADRVEPDGYGRFYLDLTGMASMYGGASGLKLAILSAVDASLQPRLGLAAGKFPAYCAAASAEVGEGFTAPGGVARWLATWPVSWLPLDPDIVARLRGFGIATMGNMAAMPSHTLADFLGVVGYRTWKLAQGIDDDPVVPTALPEALHERMEFPFPVDTISGWEAGVRLLSERIWNTPNLRGKGITEISIEGELSPNGIWHFDRQLRAPAGSSESLASAVLAGLNAQNSRGQGRWPGAALTDLSLTVSGLVRLSGRQMGLWLEERRGVAVPIIDGVDRPVALALGSPLPERRWALGSELLPLGRVAAVAVSEVHSVPRAVGSHPVRKVIDLWDVDTEWWLPEPARRRYWRLVTDGGKLITVYRNLATGGWYRQGY